MTIKDLMEDLLIEYDELGMEPTTVVPNPSERAIVWKRELMCALKHLRAELAREIFEEIEKIRGEFLEGKITGADVIVKLFLLKKKYTEAEPPDLIEGEV